MSLPGGVSIRMLAAGCGLAKALHEARCLADHAEVTPWESLLLHERNLLVEICVDLLLDMTSQSLPDVANARVAATRRVPVPLKFRRQQS